MRENRDRNRKLDKEEKGIICHRQSDIIALLSNYILVELPSDGMVKNML